jgi:hypothetical protein
VWSTPPSTNSSNGVRCRGNETRCQCTVELRSAQDRGSRCSLRPVTAGVDMSSAVKGHETAGSRVRFPPRSLRGRFIEGARATGGDGACTRDGRSC